MAELLEREGATRQRLKVRRLPFGDEAERGGIREGAYYPVIDGVAWGENGRSFWPTKADAMRVGMKALTKLIEVESLRSLPQDGGNNG